MTEERIRREIIYTYLNLYLEYQNIGIGNYTVYGVKVTQKSIDRFASRLQVYLDQ